MAESLATLIGDGKDLTEIDGIGKSVAAKCVTLVDSGSLPQLDELKSQIPQTVLAILRIPGLGPKKSRCASPGTGHPDARTTKVSLRSRARSRAKGIRCQNRKGDSRRNSICRHSRRSNLLVKGRRTCRRTARAHESLRCHRADGICRQLSTGKRECR